MMVRSKGKANASPKTSGSADVASEAALTKDSSEIENNVETGVFVETAVTEQTMITVVAEEETDGAEAEILEGENAGSEAKTLEGEITMNEDKDYKGTEVVGGDEACTADKKAEDAVGNDEGDYQETAIEQEGGKQSVDDKKVGGDVGTDKDGQEDGMEKKKDETNAKNKEEVEGSLKQKTKRLRRKNNKKRKANGPPQEQGENKQVQKKVASIGKGGEDSGNLDSEVVEQSSKKVASEDKSKVDPKDIDFEGKDEPEPSRTKSSAKKKANGMGMIFMCNSETKKDCYRYKVLGLPANKKETVEKIYKGMRLFLYDIDSKLMYGIYKAAGRGGCNIQPVLNTYISEQDENARQGTLVRRQDVEVRFTVLEECLPLAEETFRQAIKKNYYTRGKFHGQLSSEQVKALCKLFSTAGKRSRSKDTRLRPETNVVPKRDRAKRRDLDERRRPDRAPQSERVEDRRYRVQVEDRRYREQAEDHLYRAQAEDRLYREQVEDRGYREHALLHGRSLITSPLAPLAPLQPLPPPPVQSYAYNRTLGRDPYGRDTVIHPDVYRRQAVAEPPRDYYRREVIPERREYHQPLNLETRLQVAGGINDPHVSYRERLSYHVPVNSVRSQPELNPPPVGLRSEYLHGGTSSEYPSARSMLPDYPSSAAGPLYGYPRQRY